LTLAATTNGKLISGSVDKTVIQSNDLLFSASNEKTIKSNIT